MCYWEKCFKYYSKWRVNKNIKLFNKIYNKHPKCHNNNVKRRFCIFNHNLWWYEARNWHYWCYLDWQCSGMTGGVNFSYYLSYVTLTPVHEYRNLLNILRCWWKFWMFTLWKLLCAIFCQQVSTRINLFVPRVKCRVCPYATVVTVMLRVQSFGWHFRFANFIEYFLFFRPVVNVIYNVFYYDWLWSGGGALLLHTFHLGVFYILPDNGRMNDRIVW